MSIKKFVKFQLTLAGVMFAGGFIYGTLAYGSEGGTMHKIQTVQQSLHKLSWSPPLERENGDPISIEEITGFVVERLEDGDDPENPKVVETLDLGPETLELAVTLTSGCQGYRAYTVALDGTPPVDGMGPSTLRSKPTEIIRVCIVPPRKPRNFQLR